MDFLFELLVDIVSEVFLVFIDLVISKKSAKKIRKNIKR